MHNGMHMWTATTKTTNAYLVDLPIPSGTCRVCVCKCMCGSVRLCLLCVNQMSHKDSKTCNHPSDNGPHIENSLINMLNNVLMEILKNVSVRVKSG